MSARRGTGWYTRDVVFEPEDVTDIGVARPRADDVRTHLHFITEHSGPGGIMLSLSPAHAVSLLAQMTVAVSHLPYPPERITTSASGHPHLGAGGDPDGEKEPSPLDGTANPL